MSPDKTLAIVDHLYQALIGLGWTQVGLEEFSNKLLPLSAEQGHCWLQMLHHCCQTSNLLSDLGRSAISQLIGRGFQLCDGWPRRSLAITESWLGARFYLASANVLSSTLPSLNSIVCSQLGRNKQRLRSWPTLLDWAIRKSALDQASVLQIDGTTLFDSTAQYALAARIPITKIFVGDASTCKSSSLSNWLIDCLRKCLDSDETGLGGGVQQSIYISPEIAYGPSQTLGLAEPDYRHLPLQDRLSIALADRVLVVSVKAGGKIAELLEKRLICSEFPTASVFLAIAQHSSSSIPNFSTESSWLDRGAVGYLVLIDGSQHWQSFGRCRQSTPVATLQTCCSLQRWLDRDLKNWHFLTHCTRGNSGPIPQESMEAYFRRIWNEGCIAPPDPFFTLWQILREGRIRGSTWLIRGHQPVVSLSHVALPELLSRREFRNHLGRWDWEPYGLLFEHRALPQAKPVIYSTAAEYEQLAMDQQVYFQPLTTKIDWSIEQEWRVAGDIDLRGFHPESVTVFTRTRLESLQLASHSPFPVVWLAE